jgi:hypothetical protein
MTLLREGGMAGRISTYLPEHLPRAAPGLLAFDMGSA